MTTSGAMLWDAIRPYLSSRGWTSLQDLYGAASDRLKFDAGDMRPEVAGSSQHAWKRNIRNVLQSKVRSGEVVRHVNLPHYRLPAKGTAASRRQPVEPGGAPLRESGGVSAPSATERLLAFGGPTGAAARAESLVSRIIRDTGAVRALKVLYGDACQRCGTRIELPGGTAYSEGHHLQPLGRPHDGPDVPANIIVVCPNCHVLLDQGAVLLTRGTITAIAPHNVEEEYLRYHNDLARKRGAT